ncbi:MAG: ATP-binding cassette domain-containing protein [Clostridia bacterium]|nr:ATP-binding cassette domain-containing protein [Clostridia bacterium]
MIELKNITLIKNDKKILNNINLQIDDNLTTIITGPNGSGKSTLMKLIMGIEQPTSGEIIFNGQNITNYSISERANLGISFAMQQPVKFKGITVKDLLKLSLRENASNEKICDALSSVGLCPKNYLDREVGSSLSGGELKRVEIASVILRKSNLVIFDEPEAGIDIWSFNRLINLFNDLNKRLGCSVVIVSHQEKIINIADKILVLNAGQVEEYGDKEVVLPLLNKTNVTQKKCKRR